MFFTICLINISIRQTTKVRVKVDTGVFLDDFRWNRTPKFFAWLFELVISPLVFWVNLTPIFWYRHIYELLCCRIYWCNPPSTLGIYSNSHQKCVHILPPLALPKHVPPRKCSREGLRPSLIYSPFPYKGRGSGG